VTSRALGVLVALAVLAADQAAKLAVLARPEAGLDATPVAPFLDLVLRWNRGISFSLFAQDTEAGRAALLALTLVAIALLGWWLATSRSVLSASGLGAIIGGALGNALDRVARGAVVDYLDLHAFGRHFFVFNLADAAINVGVAVLIIDLAFGSRAGAADETAPGAKRGKKRGKSVERSFDVME
jgi:signal peptidase II